MTTPAGTLVFGGLIAWGIYRRVRRNIGRQPLRPTRIIISLVVLTLISVLLTFISLEFPKLLLGVGAGVALGVALGFVGLRLTKFETTDQGHFFTPNTHIGIALSVLLAARLLYRFWVYSGAGPAPGQPQLFQSPLTMFVAGLNIGYYFVYRIGLYAHMHDQKTSTQ